MVNCSWTRAECLSQRAVNIKCREPGYLGCYKRLSSSQMNTLSRSFARHTVEHDLECISICREQRQFADVAVLHRGACVCVPSNSFTSIFYSETNIHEWLCPGRTELEFKSSVCYAFNVSYGFCDQLDIVQNGKWDSNMTRFGSIVTLSCEEGYVVNGSATLQCVALPGRSTYFPVWNSSVPSCNELKCTHPGNVPNGKWDSNITLLGSIIHLDCDEGYVLNGSATLLCVTSSDNDPSTHPPIWNSSTPSCLADKSKSFGHVSKCGHPGNVLHGRWDSNITRLGSLVTLDCDDGYTIIGSAALLCVTSSNDGPSTHKLVWNASTPSCRAVKSSEPTGPDKNILMIETYEIQGEGNQVTLIINCHMASAEKPQLHLHTYEITADNTTLSNSSYALSLLPNRPDRCIEIKCSFTNGLGSTSTYFTHCPTPGVKADPKASPYLGVLQQSSTTYWLLIVIFILAMATCATVLIRRRKGTP
ncbi:uncharacterized protein [Diadema setosum]|uniref:uncharacterized protein n=1 Tax=Diadema setosum TaxID=31175 RepID=UPI003B3AED22